VTSIGATTFSQGLLNAAANTLDRSNFNRYAANGISNYYLRNYPQWNTLFLGTNHGKSWYDSLQLSVRRNVGSLRVFGNYTWSKNLDNISVDGNGTGASNTPDNFNLNQNRARSDVDRGHAFNASGVYTLPIGRGKALGGDMPGWANTLIGGWDISGLLIWQSGSVFTVSSQRATGPSTAATWANYSGDRNIGSLDRRGNGVFYFDPSLVSQFTFPNAGEFGSSGRNAFRGPRFFNIDLAVVKEFKMPFGEAHRVTFRAEFYNALNNPNFANPGVNITQAATFGRISAMVGGARIAQMALRYDF
jgi:hypothetical protein